MAASPDTDPRPSGTSPFQCLASPNGFHELIQHVLVDRRDNDRFPCGTWLYLQCKHCHVFGRAFLEDNQITWGDAPLHGNRPPR
jgi:hypothetical protein